MEEVSLHHPEAVVVFFLLLLSFSLQFLKQ